MDFADEAPEVVSFLMQPAVRQLLDHPSASLRLVTPEGKYLYTSSGVHSLLGYSPSEFVALDAWSLVHPDDLSVVKEMGAELPKNGVALTTRALTKSGEFRWVRSRMCIFQGLVATISEAADTPQDGKASWEVIPPFLEN